MLTRSSDKTLVIEEPNLTADLRAAIIAIGRHRGRPTTAIVSGKRVNDFLRTNNINPSDLQRLNINPHTGTVVVELKNGETRTITVRD